LAAAVCDPTPQVDIESEILRLSARAEDITQALAKRAREAAEADVTYKVAHAKALLLAEGPQYVRDAEATSLTEVEYRERRGTEALLLSAQEAGRNVRAQLDALRSINANHRQLVS
jgi:hypothetical protein